MAYQLTLTYDQRRGIDFVGHRNRNGNDLYDILMECIPEDVEWGEKKTITFNVPEHLAWEILQIREDEDGWPYFVESFVQIMENFCDKIV